MEAMPALVSLQGVECRYGRERCLPIGNCEIPEGKITCLLGASSCGKTTLLKLLSGKMKPTKGKILVKGARSLRALRPLSVFSDTLMIEWCKAKYQLRSKKRNETEQDQVLSLLSLAQCASRYPDQVSESEYRRLTIARALLKAPVLLLLDHPFRDEDEACRKVLWDNLKAWQRSHSLTLVFATAHVDEALAHADYVHLMRDGHVVESATPAALHLAPKTHYTASFLGPCNRLRGIVTGQHEKKAVIETDGFSLPCLLPPAVALFQEVALCIRCEDVHYSAYPQGKPFLSGILHTPQNEIDPVRIALASGRSIIAKPSGEPLPDGTRVFLWWDVERAFLVPWDTTIEE